MHGRLTPRASRLLRSTRRDERGAVAILVALCMTILLVGAGMVVDFGLVRVDRQVNKSAADAATTAGLYALNIGDAKPHPAVGVCSAVRFLQRNATRFAQVTDTSGAWRSGTGTPVANGCTDTALRDSVCKPGDMSTWVVYSWSGEWAGTPLAVTIQSGYQISASSPWPEDSLAAAQQDQQDGAQGCNQLAVSISQNRRPGFGSLATDSDLISNVRSVGRVKLGAGGFSPAMLLLERTGCRVLEVGAAGGGASSYVHVRGAVSSNGRAQPGSIHADSDGSACSGTSIFTGKASDGIVTYAAPQVTNPGAPDPTKPGLITSVAGANGVATGTVRDQAANVYNSAALDPAGAGSAAKTEPVGRGLITRAPVDDRYLAGVAAVMSKAETEVFGLLAAANAVTFGYNVVACTGSGSVNSLPAMTSASKLFVVCNNLKSIPVVQAGTVVFTGRVSPSAEVSLPNATQVYVFGGGDAITLSTGGAFRMHQAGNTAAGTCTLGTSPNNKAILVIKDGGVKQTGGTLQLCRTSLVMMGGRADGCLPTTPGTAPTQTPCGGGMGTGQIAQTGGAVDWTAPDTFDVMTLANGDDDPATSPAWSDPLGPEDLAFWTESAANGSATKASMGGGASLNVSGVFMTPNYNPFTIGGNGQQNLTNAQYIATTISLNGAVQLDMSVDPNAAVPLPRLKVVGLVR